MTAGRGGGRELQTTVLILQSDLVREWEYTRSATPSEMFHSIPRLTLVRQWKWSSQNYIIFHDDSIDY